MVRRCALDRCICRKVILVWRVEESDTQRDRYPEDMNSGSPYLASMGVRNGEGEMLGREWLWLMISGRIGGWLPSWFILIPVLAVGLLVKRVRASEHPYRTYPKSRASWRSESYFYCNSWRLVLAVAAEKKLINKVALPTSSELHIKCEYKSRVKIFNSLYRSSLLKKINHIIKLLVLVL